MRYLSVCSGIEAATVAWHPLGWTPLAFAEIAKFPRKVLAHHYPDVPLHGDFTVLRDMDWIGQADVLIGGTPCQSFSVAGLRGGLSDARGNLTLEFVRLADAIDDLRPAANPATIVWENVPGVLSSRDNAFGTLLAGLGGCDAPLVNAGAWPSAGVVVGPRRVVAWRVLDAQFFGVAQRRRRVFVLACGRAAPCKGWSAADALLPIAQGVQGHPAAGREAREGFANQPASSTSADRIAKCITRGYGSRNDTDTETFAIAVPVVSQQPSAIGVTLHGSDGTVSTASYSDTAQCLRARPPGNRDNSSTTVVHETAHTLRGTGFDASEDGTGRGTPLTVCSVSLRGREGGATAELGGDMAGTLRASGGGGDKAHAMVRGLVRRLTPVECERLQGFPDNYTAIPGAADGPRYAALGNSMAVPVISWIGRRIDAVRQRQT